MLENEKRVRKEYVEKLHNGSDYKNILEEKTSIDEDELNDWIIIRIWNYTQRTKNNEARGVGGMQAGILKFAAEKVLWTKQENIGHFSKS